MKRDPRHSRWHAVRLPILLVLILLAGGVAAWHYDVEASDLPWLSAEPTSDSTQEPAALPPTGLELPEWSTPTSAAPRPTTGALRPGKVAEVLNPILKDPDLGAHVVAAVGTLDPTGPQWSKGDDLYLPASTTKLLTVAAALEQLGPEARFTTRVMSGAKPGEVVLVGGGDPYLASRSLTSQEKATTYPARADLDTLAVATAAAHGQRRIRVRYDDGLFAGPTASRRWRADYIPDDVVSPITALMVDGGRLADGFERAEDPSLWAAQEFARALTDAGLKVLGRPQPVDVPATATEVASVQSAPLADIAEHVLDVSDNEAAEVLGHHVGLATSGKGTFAAGADGVKETLAGWGIDTTRMRLYDGSGLSRANRISTSTVLSVLRRAAGEEGERLRSVVTGLPVAAFTGSLAYRFDTAPAAARGTVRAKTGTLTGVHALAGLAPGRDGVMMAFVIAADRVGDADKVDAQAAIDRAAAALAACRCATPG